MNKRLNRILEEIQKTEKRIAEWQSHLKNLNEQRKQVEDTVILKCVRSTKLEGMELLAFLERLQEEAAALRQEGKMPEAGPDIAENNTETSKDGVQEREVKHNEK